MSNKKWWIALVVVLAGILLINHIYVGLTADEQDTNFDIVLLEPEERNYTTIMIDEDHCNKVQCPLDNRTEYSHFDVCYICDKEW